jgi:shikimate kinase
VSDPIVLMGASGAGKTTVGRLVASRLDLPFVDVDSEVERQAGRTIRSIFEEDGEAAFRALEAEATLAALTRPAVVSLGGGAPMTERVAEVLRGHRHVIWLQVTPEAAARRIGIDAGRPLISGRDAREALTTMLATRTPVYSSVASLVLDTQGRAPEQVADDVIAFAHRSDRGTTS